MLKFLLIGTSNSGKTTYITTLAMQPHITAKNNKTLHYLQTLKNKLRNNNEISKTTNFITLEFNYKKENIIEFQLDDYDGEIVEKYHKSGDILLFDTIKKAQAVLLFIPYEKTVDISKKDALNDEIDIFIENLKNKQIPITIVITKWDKAKNISYEEYLKQNYNELLTKLNLYFSTISIINISSIKNLNILKPIDITIDNIVQEWDKKIQNISNKKELFLYLHSIYEAIKYYPKYLSLYNELENEIFEEIFEKLKSLNLKEFNEYKKENKKLIEAFNTNHKKKIKKIHNNFFINFMKQITVISIAIVIFSVITFLFMKQTNYYKNERNLYTKIEHSFKENNIQKTLLLIKNYKKKYDLHLLNIAKIEADLITKCQKDVSNKYHFLLLTKTIEKQKELLDTLIDELEICNIPKKPYHRIEEKINDIYKKYIYITQTIQNLSINNIDKFDVNKFNNILLQLSNYPEKENILKLLNQKFSLISNSLNDTTNIQKFIDIAIQLNINKNIINKLNKKLHYAQIQEEFNQFLDELLPMDFDESISYVKIKWQKKFNSYTNLLKIRQLLNTKFNQKIKNNLAELNDIVISNSNDLNLFKKELNKIYTLSHTKIKIINYIPKLNIENKNEYKSLLSRYYKYQTSSFIPTQIKFVADNKNNKPLEFKCDGDKEIDLNITKNKISYNYTYKNSQCFQTTMIFKNKHKFHLGNYDVKVIKYNTFVNAKYGSAFKITRDDIINIKNKNSLKKDLGNGYKLIFTP